MSYRTVSTNEANPAGGRSRFFLWLTLAIVCVWLVAAFRVGLHRGFPDEIGTEAWGRLMFGIGAAVSQMEHGGYGYTISNVIETVLTYGGLTGDSKVLADLGTTFPDNLRNPNLINTAIDKAVHFKWPFDPNKEIRGSGGDDLGFVDYVRVSFHLFGYKLQSLYFTYFVIFGISILAFIYAFRSRPALLAVLVIISAAQVFLFSSSLFDSQNLGSISDPRFLSALAIIPGVHLACLMLTRSSPTASNISLALLQSVILVFAFWIRASAIWVIFGVLVLTALVAVQEIRGRRLKLRSMWGLGVLLAVWALQTLWASVAVHPIYKEKGEIAHHVIWHAVFYQLQFHPEWERKYAAEYDNAQFDQLPMVAAKKYLLRHPDAASAAIYQTEDHEHLKIAATETYTRKAFFEFFANDPKFVLEAYFIYSPINVLRILGPLNKPSPTGNRNVGIMRSLDRNSVTEYALLGITLVFLAGFLAIENVERRLFTRCALFMTAAFFVSVLPILPAPNHTTMGDQYFLLLIVLGSWSMLALCAVIRMSMRLMRSFRTGGQKQRAAQGNLVVCGEQHLPQDYQR
jgi:hypothetical protein